MSIDKATLRTRVLQAADATGSSWRWDITAGGEVDFWIGQVHDAEWARILNVNQYYRVGRRTPTSDASGRYLVSDLSSGSGDSAERFYRVIAFAVDNTVYKQVEAKDFVIDPSSSNGLLTPWYYWWFEGDYIKALPEQANKQADVVIVNHRPTRYDSLSGESVNVPFPDGYESVIVLEAAAALLNKGGVESGAAMALKAEAEVVRNAMLQDLARKSTNPTQMRYDDYAQDWGG
jgi:hypothetical protein